MMSGEISDSPHANYPCALHLGVPGYHEFTGTPLTPHTAQCYAIAPYVKRFRHGFCVYFLSLDPDWAHDVDSPKEPLNEAALPHKLAAILYADVEGYSRLTGADESGTHRTLSAYLDLFTDTIKAHRGEVKHYAGDAILADFSTVSDALNCAVEFQKASKEKNETVQDDKRVKFRIGLNLGEVIVDRGEVYGNGVNVAARLETLAEPGGICAFGTVVDAVGTKLPLAYEFLGEQRVKNIDKPVNAYRVNFTGEPSTIRNITPAPARKPRKLWPAVEPVGRNRAALRRMINAKISDKLNPCPTIVAPGISAAPGSLP